MATINTCIQTTKKQVQTFKDKISKLQRKFKTNGPGAEGVELEAGLELVKKFTTSLAKYTFFFLFILFG